MKLKKLLATTLAIVLLLSSVSMTAFAFKKDEFDIENLTWDDIMTMNNEEFKKLLNQFEREYDPFGTYETNPLTENREGTPIEPGIQPLWTSGDNEWQIVDGKLEKVYANTGSHERITVQACYVLMNDKGFWGADTNGSILIVLSLSLASINPDRDFSLGLGQAYAGHFYDPDEDADKSNTAKTNAKKFYNQAVKDYKENTDEFLIDVGNMIHYVQDVCEPHHSAGLIAVFSSHSEFEEYANNKIESYIGSMTSISNSIYVNAVKLPIDTIVDTIARRTKDWYSPYIDNSASQALWDSVARDTTQNAVAFTAAVLYKLSLQANIPLTK